MAEYAYIGIRPCGHMRAIVVDDPLYPRETALAVAQFIRDGLRIERVTIDDGNARLTADIKLHKECGR